MTVYHALNSGSPISWEGAASMKLNSLSTNPTKWSNTVKQFCRLLSTNCLGVFDHFMQLALKGLTYYTRGVFRILSNICNRAVFFIIDVWKDRKLRIWYRKKIPGCHALKFLQMSLYLLRISQCDISLSSCV